MSWASKLIKPYRINDGRKFRLQDFDPADTAQVDSKGHAEELLTQGIAAMSVLQDKLYAEDCWSLLLIFQGMDASGKDGAIKHVMSGVNPEGVQVFSFKTPSSEELNHDFLWRTTTRLPQRGRIGIFNRSYYEEVLVVRVHPHLLKGERTPPSLISKDIWKERFHDINAFEKYLSRNGTVIRKFFLNLSRKEQKRRFLERLDQPAKNWKFSSADVEERACWEDYMKAYEDMIVHTATPHAPWYVVPADNKWFTRVAVAAAIVETLEDLKVAYPRLNAAKKRELQSARTLLEAKKKT
jgi:PPK2 family polyphosphate:nucleotide phosphotransferase